MLTGKQRLDFVNGLRASAKDLLRFLNREYTFGDQVLRKGYLAGHLGDKAYGMIVYTDAGVEVWYYDEARTATEQHAVFHSWKPFSLEDAEAMDNDARLHDCLKKLHEEVVDVEAAKVQGLLKFSEAKAALTRNIFEQYGFFVDGRKAVETM